MIALALVFCVAFGVDRTAAENTASDDALPGLAALIPELRRGGHVIYLRHAATDHSTNDINIDFERCDTQRNLSDPGRAQAVAIGKAFKDLAIPVGTVLSSPFCRTMDTARLAFGDYRVNQDLFFAMSVGEDERARLAEALRRLLSTPPEPGTNTVIVAHTANLKETAGLWPKPEGAAYIFRPREDGGFLQVSAVIAPGDWTSAARAAAAP